jgi:hypothetical protein
MPWGVAANASSTYILWGAAILMTSSMLPRQNGKDPTTFLSLFIHSQELHLLVLYATTLEYTSRSLTVNSTKLAVACAMICLQIRTHEVTLGHQPVLLAIRYHTTNSPNETNQTHILL